MRETPKYTFSNTFEHCLKEGKSWPLRSLVCDVFLCFVTFPYGVLGQLWYSIVWVPDFYLLSHCKRKCSDYNGELRALRGYFRPLLGQKTDRFITFFLIGLLTISHVYKSGIDFTFNFALVTEMAAKIVKQ